MKRMLITGSVWPSVHERGKQLAKSLRRKPSELVAIAYAKLLDEIERTGALVIPCAPEEEETPLPRGMKRGHALFGN